MLATETIAPNENQQTCLLQVEVELVERTIQVVANLAGRKQVDHAIPIREINLPTLLELVNLTLKPLILNCLPVDEVHFELGPKLIALNRADITENLENCGRCLVNTNKFLQRYIPQAAEFQDHDQVLLYSMGKNQFLEDINARGQRAGLTHVHFRQFSCGFDAKERHWQGEVDCFSPNELMEFVLEHRIKRIVSVNMYYLQFLAQHHGVMIQTVFEKLGLEYTIVDWDIYSFNDRYGLNKLVYDHPKMQRFDIFPVMQSAWNKLLGFENIRYYCVSLASEIENPEVRLEESSSTGQEGDRSWLLDEDYVVLCAGHARIETLLEGNRLSNVLAVLDTCTEETLFRDFQVWFYAAADYLLNHLRRPTAQKLKLWAQLIQLHFDCITLLKYEVLDQLRTERELLLYGDEGWGQLFPHYFSGEHISKPELWEKIRSKKYLNLQFNNVLSYYESNPVSGDVLSCGAPFLGFPAVVCEEDISAFSRMEFSCVAEMNRKVADINPFLDDPSLALAISSFQKNTQTFREEALEQLGNTAANTNVNENARLERSSGADSFAQLCARYQKLSNQITSEYITQHKSEMEQFFRCFEAGNLEYDNNSTYSQRDYVNKLRALKAT